MGEENGNGGVVLLYLHAQNILRTVLCISIKGCGSFNYPLTLESIVIGLCVQIMSLKKCGICPHLTALMAEAKPREKKENRVAY